MLSVFGVIYGVLYWLPRWLSGNKSTCQCRKHRFNPWAGLIPGLGRSLGGRNGNPLQYSCLENSIDRGAWLVTVHGVAKSQTQLSTHIRTHTHTNVLLCWFWGNHKFSGFPLIFFSGLWTSFSPLLECSRMWLLGLFSLLYLHSVNSLSLLGSLL